MGSVDATNDLRRKLRPRGLVSVAALAVTGLLIAGCGGGGGKAPGVANVSSSHSPASRNSSSSSTASDGGAGGVPTSSSGSGQPKSGFSIQTANPRNALKLSECMRANGVPNFPDPNGQGVIQGSGIDPNSRQFQSAQQKCAKDLGRGLHAPSPAQIAKVEAAALAYSKCMRSHGVTDFPDPQFGSGGGIRISMHAKAGGAASDLDPNSPIFEKAQKDCGSLLPGRAGVRLGA